MRTITRAVALVAAASLALTPSVAHAERGSVSDGSGDATAGIDITRVVTKHGAKRVKVVAQIPDLELRRLSTGLSGAYWDEQTPFSPLLAPGRSSTPETSTTSETTGTATARGGLVVRGLPTTRSARKGKLARDEDVAYVANVGAAPAYCIG